jgi:hypothetical protein
MIDQTINNTLRESLSEHDKQYYDAFVQALGRKPESMMDLMQGSAVIRESNKKEREFWSGVFGI